MASPRGGLREEADPGEEAGVAATGLSVAAEAGHTASHGVLPAVLGAATGQAAERRIGEGLAIGAMALRVQICACLVSE